MLWNTANNEKLTAWHLSGNIFLKPCCTLITAGTIISWVPRPNKNAPTDVNFNDDSWIECNGTQTCKSGPFEGQFCTNLRDRVLVGEGDTGRLLHLYDASLPDHAHRHVHDGIPTGKQTFNVKYRTGEKYYHDSGKALGWGDGSGSKKHNHNDELTTTFTVDFGKMKPSEEGFISKIKNPKVSISTAENDLYSPHMRVVFMFKCF